MGSRVTRWLVALFGAAALIMGIVGAVAGGDAAAQPQLLFLPTTLVVHCFPSPVPGVLHHRRCGERGDTW